MSENLHKIIKREAFFVKGDFLLTVIYISDIIKPLETHARSLCNNEKNNCVTYDFMLVDGIGDAGFG